MVEAGWITSDLASPTLARWLRSWAWSMNRFPASYPPAIPNDSTPPNPFLRYFLAAALIGMRGQSGIAHPGHLGVLLEPLGQLESVVHLTLDSQREGLQSLKEQEGVERRQRRSEVAEPFDPCPDRKADVPERTIRVEHIGEDQTVITRERAR